MTTTETFEEISEQKTLQAEYGLTALLFINIVLVSYVSFRLCYFLYKFCTSPSLEKKSYKSRLQIFGLIWIYLLLVGASRALHLYETLTDQIKQDRNPFLLIIDTVPTLFFITITTTFAYRWYKIYSSYDEAYQARAGHFNSFKAFLLLFNLVFYIGFIALSIYYSFHLSFNAPVIMQVILIPGIIGGALLLRKHGNTLQDRTVKLLNYTGRRVQTSGFRTIYLILIFCCWLKCIQEVVAIVFSGTDEFNLSLGFFIGYVVIFNIIGEYGVFLSIILLLEKNAARSSSSVQASFQRETLLPHGRFENSQENAYANSDSDFDVETENERRNRMIYIK